MEINAEPGKSVLLRLGLKDGNTSRFPQAEIYDSAGSIVGSVHDLAHVPGSDGLYHKYITAPTKGDYTVRYRVYTDAGHTTLGSYEIESDGLRVHSVWRENILDHYTESGSFAEALLAIFAHAGGYYVRDDATSYNTDDRPTAFRRRIFIDLTSYNNSTHGGTGEGEVLTITASGDYFNAVRWKSLKRILS